MRYAQVRLFINSSLRTNDTLFGCTPGMAALTLQRAFQMGDAVTWRHQQQRRTKEVVNHALMYIKIQSFLVRFVTVLLAIRLYSCTHWPCM